MSDKRDQTRKINVGGVEIGGAVYTLEALEKELLRLKGERAS